MSSWLPGNSTQTFLSSLRASHQMSAIRSEQRSLEEEERLVWFINVEARPETSLAEIADLRKNSEIELINA